MFPKGQLAGALLNHELLNNMLVRKGRTKQVCHSYFILSQLRQFLQQIAGDNMASSLLSRKLHNFLEPAAN